MLPSRKLSATSAWRLSASCPRKCCERSQVDFARTLSHSLRPGAHLDSLSFGFFLTLPWHARSAWLRSRRRRRGSVSIPARAVATASPPAATKKAGTTPAHLRKAISKGSQKKRPWEGEDLPIHKVLPSILKGIDEKRNLVLQAPTGAGKTTMVPLAVLQNGIEGKIIVMQPRRITCINVARRMAQLWGEPLGETVGYRIRHESVVSNRTKIEVVTEGILTRMLLGNPDLEGVGCIFFDEFHERNIDSDMGFALVVDAQKKRRLPVRVIVMSATLGTLGPKVQELVGESTTITSEGRMFPVAVSYRGVMNLRDWEPKGPQIFARTVAKQVQLALKEHEGDVLVFVPGEREIMYVWIALNNMGIGDGKRPKNLVAWADKLIDKSKVDLSKKIKVCPLYGTMESKEQDDVIMTDDESWRKVILATPIAESSLTVPTVRIVIDTGLRRMKVTNAATFENQMLTVPVSKAAAEQRRGRAGRVAEGVCWRLWEEAEHSSLETNDTPELLKSDLTAPVLDLAISGFVTNQEIASLPWVDLPRVEDLDVARMLLERMKAFRPRPGGVYAVTERGRTLGSLPVHPRIAHMIYQAYTVSDSFARDACDLAAMLEEKEVLRGGRRDHGVNLEARLDALQNPRLPDILMTVRERVLMASAQLQNILSLKKVEAGRQQRDWERKSLSILVAWAFPELLAETVSHDESKINARGKMKHFRLHSGSDVVLEDRDPLSGCPNVAIASVTGEKVFWALRADLSLMADYGIDATEPTKHKVFHKASEQVESDAAAENSFLEIRRYMVGKDFSDFSSEEELVAYMGKHPEEFPSRDVADLLWDLARTDSPRIGLLVDIVNRIVVSRQQEFACDELVETACALAVAGFTDDEPYDALAYAIMPKLGELPLDSEGGNLAALLWAFTEANVAHGPLFDALAERGVRALVESEPKVLSDVRETCFWSFHRASATAWSNRNRIVRASDRLFGSNSSSFFNGFAHHGFFEKLAPLVTSRLSEINPICVVYLMWTFSKSRYYDKELFDAVASRVAPEVQNLDRCGLSMFVWNYSYSEESNEDVFSRVAEETVRDERMAELTPRDIANIASAFARGQILNHSLLQALADHGCGLLRDGIDQECYRRPMKSLARDIYEDDDSARDGMVDAFDMVSLAEMLGACADQQFVHPQFLELADEYMRKGCQQPPRDVASFLRFPQVFARTLVARARMSADENGRNLFQTAAPHVVRLLDDLGAQHVVRLTWAWAVTGPRDPWVLAALSTRLHSLLQNGGGRSIEAKDVSDAKWALDQLKIRDRKLLNLLNSLS